MRGDQGLQGRDREAQGHAVGRRLAWQWLLGPSLIRGQEDFQGERCPWCKRRATADLHTLPRHRSVGAGLCSEGHLPNFSTSFPTHSGRPSAPPAQLAQGPSLGQPRVISTVPSLSLSQPTVFLLLRALLEIMSVCSGRST